MIWVIWIAVIVLAVVNVVLWANISLLAARCGRMEINIRRSMAGKLLPPDTSDPGSRL